ncbi:MAG: hypothetical protein COT43_06245 [Candidatus Marinimicrobia bacterium CG08_land_8_20_14_0_20_45_22]|nr:MAG: hypothetical protein COT43_06245 [Candidatus Marinimicrobia bacterium CG08_land_8_20_14_0_20_45_22]
MAIVKWTPRGSLVNFRNEFDKMFDTFFNTGAEETGLTAVSPAVDIEENEKEFVLTAELPGSKKEDVKVNVHENMLSISGEKTQEKKINEKNYRLNERMFGKFERSFRLPDSADQEHISAEFKHGVLIVTIPKLKESLAKRVEINVK